MVDLSRGSRQLTSWDDRQLTPLNSILLELQSRLSTLEGRSGEVVILGNQKVEGRLQLQELQTADVPALTELGSIYRKTNYETQTELWGVEYDGQLNRRLRLQQRAFEDGTLVGKASDWNFTTGLSLSLDKAADVLTISVDAGGIDHGGLAGLGDDDHTQYLLIDGTRDMTGDLNPNASGTLDLGGTGEYWRDGYINRVRGAINLELRADTAAVQVQPGGSTKWTFAGAGDLTPAADDSYDIGATGAQVADLWLTHLKSDGYIARKEATPTPTVYLRSPDPSHFMEEDDFTRLGADPGDASGGMFPGTLPWIYYESNAAGTITPWEGEYGRPGGIFFTPGGNTYTAALYSHTSKYHFINTISWGRWVTIIRHSSVLRSLDERIGLVDNVTYGSTTDGIYWGYDYSAFGDDNFRFTTKSGGTATTTDTGVAAQAGANPASEAALLADPNAYGWFKLEFVYTPTEVTAYIDDVLVATHTTNIPATSSQTLQWAWCLRQAATGTPNLVIDYYGGEWKAPR